MIGQRYGLFCMVTCSWIHYPGEAQRTSLNNQVDFPDLSVVVNAGGGGSDIVAKQVPGRASRIADGKDHAYIVDFIHPWDRENPVLQAGDPGPLLANDFSRRRAYKDLGFEQCQIQSITQLPFVDPQAIRQTPTVLRKPRNLLV